MRRVAAHWLYLPDGSKIHLPVVEIEEKRVVNYYPIEDELPETEWLGGIFILSSLADSRLSKSDSLVTVLRKLHPDEKAVRYPLYCWYLNGIDLDSNHFTSSIKLELLEEED